MSPGSLWRHRLHGWPWLLAPVVLLWLAGLPLVIDSQLLLAFWSVVGALALIGVALGLWRVTRPLSAGVTALRRLAAGRAETRVAPTPAGVTGALYQHINAVARLLLQARDASEQQLGQVTGRLRQDLQRLQEKNEQLRRALEEAQDSARAQSELFSNLSHELRTPLTAILGYADLLRRSGLQSEQRQQLNTLDKSARALLAMINDLLDWSRMEVGQLRLNIETFDVHDAVEDTVALLAPLAYDKALELLQVVDHDVPEKLIGDSPRLRQILTNLLSNAIKFTENGEVVLRVRQEKESGNQVWLRFAVSDTGCGIPLEQQRRLFQPFHQVGRNVRGSSGLGLSITRRLAELMEGGVELESTPGEGSTFSVVLPFRLGPPSERHWVPALREREAWVLEPHTGARRALAHWLEFWGLQLRYFEALQPLRAALQETRPEIVLLGLKEIDADDPQVLDLCGACQERQLPLVVLVASASLEVHQGLRDAGATACHPKSISRRLLQAELLRLLQPAAPAAPALPGQRIIVADNNPVNRRYIAALCTSLGLETTECDDGAQALAAWRAQPSDYVLLDARMPVMDGPTCARGIRQLEIGQGRHCRILAISAHLEPQERREFLDAGADEILLKPFDERQLLRALAPEARMTRPTAAVRPTDDPSLLDLLRQELPQQLAELEAAWSRDDLSAAREAAHQLNGTAAFYHLQGLRQRTHALETALKRASGLDASLLEPLQTVRVAVAETVRQIASRLPAS